MIRFIPALLLLSFVCASSALAQRSGELSAQTARLENLIPQWTQRSLNVTTYSPDGRHVVFGGTDLLVFDAKSRRFVKRIGDFDRSIVAMAFSPDGRRLAVEQLAEPGEKRVGHEIVVFAFPEGAEISRFAGLSVPTGQGGVRALRFSPDGSKLATSDHERIVVLSAADGSEVWTWKVDTKTNPNQSGAAFDVTPDWKYFLFKLQRIACPSGEAGAPVVFDAKSPKKRFGQNWISRDGTRAVAVDQDGRTKKLFDLNTGAELKESRGFGFGAGVMNAAFDRLASVGGVWLVNENREVTYNAYFGDTTHRGIAFHPSRNEIAASFYHLDLDAMPEKPDILRATQPDYKGAPYVGLWFAGSAQSNVLYRFDRNNKNRVFADWGNAATRGFLLDENKWEPAPVRAVHDATFGNVHVIRNASGTLGLSRDGKLHYPADAGREPRSFLPEGVRQLGGAPGFAGDSLIYFKTARSNQFHLVPVEALDKVRTIEAGPDENVALLSVSADGGLLALGIQNTRTWLGRVEIHDTATARRLYEDREFSGQIRFDRSGRVFASFEGKRISLHDIATGEVTKSWRVESGRVIELDFSADGERLVITNDNGLNEVIDSRTKSVLVTLVGRTGLHNMAAFGPDGRMIERNPQARDFFYAP